jgi:hypothetical protein
VVDVVIGRIDLSQLYFHTAAGFLQQRLRVDGIMCLSILISVAWSSRLSSDLARSDSRCIARVHVIHDATGGGGHGEQGCWSGDDGF